ncbi:hypothetical protein N7280_05595 [Rickettsia rhipicephali]|uniref:hypothetical protein n=1 Tax=Rickettsia rhipicephali TaxID=33992 RepID=UPI00225867C5|nr:hypothetical protein [Rickettsia rhipicephali]MCX4080052.1 hypothetical protein [Rickettsia rhipicephali]
MYYKHNMLAGFKKEDNQDQVVQLNITTHKAIEPCSHHKQYAGLKVGDNYSFGFMR